MDAMAASFWNFLWLVLFFRGVVLVIVGFIIGLLTGISLKLSHALTASIALVTVSSLFFLWFFKVPFGLYLLFSGYLFVLLFGAAIGNMFGFLARNPKGQRKGLFNRDKYYILLYLSLVILSFIAIVVLSRYSLFAS